jgi:FAD/FMN-containing dehydrogenase
VRADGEIVDALGAVEKDGAGYDISAALVGSEGTLGVITAARLRLHSPLPALHTFLIGCNSWGHARAIYNGVAKSGVRVLAAEALDQATMRTVREVNSLPPALAKEWPVYLLIEADDVIEIPEDVEATMAMDANDRARLWKYREEASVSISTHANVHKMDVSLPVQHLDDFTKALETQLPNQPGVTRAVVFGHVAEGNLHVDVAGPSFDDFAVDELVYKLAAKFQGSVASEHGVGRVKPHLLPLVRQQSYLDTLKCVKSAWDPNWLLNPGVLVLRD